MPFTLKIPGFALFLIFSIILPVSVLYAGDDLIPGSLIDKTFIFNSSTTESDKPAVYQNLNRWVLEEKSDKVQNALEVYKKKGGGQYQRRIWLTNRADGTKRLIAEFAAKGAGDKVIFSPNEDFMYYLGLTPAGATIVYGVDLTSNQKFTVGTGNDFQSIRCPDNKNYVVLHQQKGGRTVYQVFSTSGERLKTLTDAASPLDIEKNLCRNVP